MRLAEEQNVRISHDIRIRRLVLPVNQPTCSNPDTVGNPFRAKAVRRSSHRGGDVSLNPGASYGLNAVLLCVAVPGRVNWDAVELPTRSTP